MPNDPSTAIEIRVENAGYFGARWFDSGGVYLVNDTPAMEEAIDEGRVEEIRRLNPNQTTRVLDFIAEDATFQSVEDTSLKSDTLDTERECLALAIDPAVSHHTG